ncbi:serine protease [Akkermansiaceae bacterium]|nr:serine protease [Akkermansiaceae bacterium]MDA7888494.1 serine protease [Akkermansiaceae bacterium]
MSLPSNSLFHVTKILALAFTIQQVGAQDDLQTLEKLTKADPGPFVIVEGSGEATKSRAQGVIVSPQGHVLSVGHIAWIEADKAFTDKFRISFRGTGKNLPVKPSHVHKAVFTDKEDTKFFEHYFPAKLLEQGESRFIGKSDLAVFQLPAGESYPIIDFFSKEKPVITSGDTLHLCHFTFPHKAGNPSFLMNEVEVVGVAKTSSGLQYLAKGFYRIGSSGGALLKDGKLIGIQSAAYTINTKENTELPHGLISFELVWSDLIEKAITPSPKTQATPSK